MEALGWPAGASGSTAAGLGCEAGAELSWFLGLC